MRKLIIAAALILGIGVAFGQMTTKISLHPGMEIQFIFKGEYSQVRMKTDAGAGGYLKVRDYVMLDGCAIFDVLGADDRVFYLTICTDNSANYTVGGDSYDGVVAGS